MKRLPQALGIRARLWLAAALPAVLVTLALLWLFMDRHERNLAEAVADRVRANALQMASAAEFGLFVGDRQNLQRQVNQLFESAPELLGVAVIPADGQYRVVAGKLPAQLPPFSDEVITEFGDVLTVSVPVHYTAIQMDAPFALTPALRAGMAPIGWHTLSETLAHIACDMRGLCATRMSHGMRARD